MQQIFLLLASWNCFLLSMFSIMPNRLVRDQLEYLRKMEQHFRIKPSRLIGMVLAMEQQLLVKIFQAKEVDQLQRWSWIVRSEETEIYFSIWILTKISGIFVIRQSILYLSVSMWAVIGQFRRLHCAVQSVTIYSCLCFQSTSSLGREKASSLTYITDLELS